MTNGSVAHDHPNERRGFVRYCRAIIQDTPPQPVAGEGLSPQPESWLKPDAIIASSISFAGPLEIVPRDSVTSQRRSGWVGGWALSWPKAGFADRPSSMSAA